MSSVRASLDPYTLTHVQLWPHAERPVISCRVTVPITIELDTRDDTMESAFARTKAFLTERLAALVNVSEPGVMCQDLGDEIRALWSDGTIELVDDGEPPDLPVTSSAAGPAQLVDHTLAALGGRHLRLLSRSE